MSDVDGTLEAVSCSETHGYFCEVPVPPPSSLAIGTLLTPWETSTTTAGVGGQYDGQWMRLSVEISEIRELGGDVTDVEERMDPTDASFDYAATYPYMDGYKMCKDPVFADLEAVNDDGVHVTGTVRCDNAGSIGGFFYPTGESLFCPRERGRSRQPGGVLRLRAGVRRARPELRVSRVAQPGARVLGGVWLLQTALPRLHVHDDARARLRPEHAARDGERRAHRGAMQLAAGASHLHGTARLPGGPRRHAHHRLEPPRPRDRGRCALRRAEHARLRRRVEPRRAVPEAAAAAFAAAGAAGAAAVAAAAPRVRPPVLCVDLRV